jgi:ribonuclease P protein component
METLKNSAQFERVRREGRTWGGGLLVLNAARNGDDLVRCGFITGKKVGKAVQRNRARRLMREAVRKRLPDIDPGWDLVWIARAPIVGATYEAVREVVDDLLRRSRVVAQITPNNLQSPPKIVTPEPQSRIIDVAGSQAEVAAPTGGMAHKERSVPQR